MEFKHAPPEIVALLRRLQADGEPTNTSNPNMLQVGPRPRAGTEAHVLTLFYPLNDDIVDRYEQIHAIHIHPAYRDILRSMNGGQAFQLDLYGVPPSMAESPPLLDRSSWQPLDLATANKYWRAEFNARDDEFHFGSSSWSYSENVGYFVSDPVRVRGLLKGGECVGEWPTLSDCLLQELQRNEDRYPEYEEFMESLLKKHS